MIKNIFHCCFTKTQTVGAWNIKSYKPAHYTNYVPPKGSTQYKQYADDQRLTFHAYLQRPTQVCRDIGSIRGSDRR